ncbi:UNVERIFIED_CONTAM: hypothetical protein FKN15_051776 [Acipenser sinensis]
MEEIPVKVAVRLRPLLPKEILHNQQVCVRVVPYTQVIMGKDRAFTFDFVFGQKSLQNELYVTCIKPLVLSLIEGYNVTVFAYGQTGSGKTYTIGGGHVVSSSDEEKGIIPRAIQEIFHSISENHNRDFTVKVSYIEVYKEELRDLLELETSFKDMHIREDEKGNTVIVGARESLVETADEVISLLESGNAARHTGTTQMNKHSSRSHTIFTITLISSKFHFFDLAGSERAAKTGNTGERFKESIQINSGLLALGNVISALGDPKRKSLHVPYRDTKITRILKDSLGGNTKTVMITCISPSSLNFDESLNSLKYANRAKNIKNKPIVNYNPNWYRMDEMELEIRALREALQNQRASQMTCASRVSQDLPGGHDKTRNCAMEGQLAQLQVECYQYRACTENAILLELKGMASLPKIHKHKLQEWLDTAEELQRENPSTLEADSGVGSAGEETHHITILQLKRELKKCQENEEHLAALEDEKSKRRIQNEKMVEQQLIIDQLREGLLNIKQSKSCVCVNGAGDAAASVTSSKRPYSVPLGNKHQPDSSQNTPRPDTRKDAELRLTQAKQKTKELAINIKMKEELIKELVKTGKDAQEVNRHYSMKIAHLEQEADHAKKELAETQKQLQELESREFQDGTEIARLQREFRKKVDTAKLKVQVLQKKQQDTKKLACLSSQSEKRLIELEQNVDHMKRQQTQLHKKLREEAEKKKKLETEIYRDQQRIKNRKWLDDEVEKVLQQRRTLAKLEDELKKREEIIAKKEALSQGMSQLEIKKLRSSQVEVLQQERNQLLKRRDCLDDTLRNGRVLTAEEEHILFQLEERIEALDAAIDFKNDTIDSQQHCARDSTEMLTSSEAGIMVKLSTLSFSEIKALLFRYFNKISQILLVSFTEQGSDGLAENINIYEAKVRQLEKDLFFYKKTSRELKKKLKEIVADSLNQQSASTKGNGDDQEKIVSISEEDKWATKFESNKANANSQKDSASFPTSARAQNSRIWDEIAEIAQTPTSASRRHLASYKEQSAVDEAPYLITALSSVPQSGDSAAQLPGVTPVRVSRRELRRISASELSNRRSSLGAKQGSDGLAENINIYEAKVRQLEKDLFFYKKTSRELKKKLKEIVADSLNQQSASTKGNGDDQEKIVSISEEDKWATKFESNKANANSQKDSASFPTSARAQNSRIWDEIAEIAQTPTSASRKHLASYKEQSAVAEAPYLITALSSVPQTGDSAAQLPGVTPVRVSRRELRQISASELSNRRSSLGASVTSIQEDSIEIS